MGLAWGTIATLCAKLGSIATGTASSSNQLDATARIPLKQLNGMPTLMVLLSL